MKQQMLEKEVAELKAENAKLRAQIDNLQAPRPAATIVEVIGEGAFDRMVEMYPSFRESGTPTNPTDAASEVLWSSIRMLVRMEKQMRDLEGQLDDVKDGTREQLVNYSTLLTQHERAINALAEFAMRAAEEAEA